MVHLNPWNCSQPTNISTVYLEQCWPKAVEIGLYSIHFWFWYLKWKKYLLADAGLLFQMQIIMSHIMCMLKLDLAISKTSNHILICAKRVLFKLLKIYVSFSFLIPLVHMFFFGYYYVFCIQESTIFQLEQQPKPKTPCTNKHTKQNKRQLHHQMPPQSSPFSF